MLHIKLSGHAPSLLCCSHATNSNNYSKQANLKSAHLRQGECGLNPKSGRLPEVNENFLVKGYICDKIFMKIRSGFPEI